MRKILLCFFLLAFSMANATVLTVNNNNPSPGQYTNFLSAYIAANIDDTLYLNGSPNSYGYQSIDKRITIIGSGFAPYKQLPLTSKIDKFTFYTGSENTKIIGLIILNTIEFPSWAYATNINFENCSWQSHSFPAFDLKADVKVNLRGCLIERDYLASEIQSRDFELNMENCVLECKLGNSYVYLTGLISNCLFMGNGSNTFCENASNLIIQNSIFLGVSPQITSYNYQTTAYNNLVYGAQNNNFNTTISLGNVNADPLFVSAFGLFYGYNPGNDYHLLSSSPGHLAGIDGTDIGLYGGAKYFNKYGEPGIPQIRAFNVPAGPVPAGSTITIDFTSTVKP
jgi:hypothetical protein